MTSPPAPAPFEESVFSGACPERSRRDGDGKRVKSVINGLATTYFVGTHYEVTGGVVTKYYYAGTQRIAMRTGGTLNYLLGDHLGSTSLVTDASGNNPIETRYKAWGEVRFESGTTPTKYTYTGQYSYTGDFGLMFYNARWYDPSLGRFAQADNIIPLSQGIQGWDRYAYAINNPVQYVDPTGHDPICSVCLLLAIFRATPLWQTAVGNLPDYQGVALTMAITDPDDVDAVVAAGLAVQSEYPWAIVGGDARGFAQATDDELADGKDPYSPSDSVDIMQGRIDAAIEACGPKRCPDGSDRLIVAAISQNGYTLDFKSLPKEADGSIDWNKTFASDIGGETDDPAAQLRQSATGMNYSTKFMLKIYVQDLRLLLKAGYKLPDWATEEDLDYIEKTFLNDEDEEK